MSKANHIPCWEFYWEEQDQQKEESYYPLLLGTGEVAPGIVVQFWVPPPSPKRMWRNLERVQQQAPEAGSSPMRRDWWSWVCIVWHGGD